MTGDEVACVIFIYVSGVIGLVWGIYNTFAVKGIKVEVSSGDQDNLQEPINQEGMTGLEGVLKIGKLISDGANSFLFAEYKIMAIFIVIFSIIVLVVVDVLGQANKSFRVYATLSFIIGSVTSILCGFIGMRIAVEANYRTAYKATKDLEGAFRCAFQAGCVMGFIMTSVSMIILITLLLVYVQVFEPKINGDEDHNYQAVMDLLSGYGLGGSSMALFGRVGGGIYTKAADVGADLVGKVEENLAEDSPQNPATIADNVGDNVGDIAGMGSDLFGSFAEATCAALVLTASNTKLINPKMTALYFPIAISAAGILACLLTSIVGIFVYKVDVEAKIEKALNLQLLISTVLMLIALFIIGPWFLPSSWAHPTFGKPNHTAHWYYSVIATGMGLISGFLIGVSTDYYTSNAHAPVQDMANVCYEGGAALNVIYGLALGYLSTIIPIILLAITIIVSTILLDMLGVALAAIGMLSSLAVCLAIDAYGPISDNAGGIAEMAALGEHVRKRTDALDAAGNTTAAVGKGFAIGSAALVSLALYGAFLTRCANGTIKPGNNVFKTVIVNDGWIFGSMFIGAMLPYFFSALTMKSVGVAANEMVIEVRRQFEDVEVKEGRKSPDYAACIAVSTRSSLKEMIAPGCLVMLTPIAFGILIHPKLVAGILPGALLSGIQLAISMSNTGGAWDNAKKQIEQEKNDPARQDKWRAAKDAAVVGDTIGDPLKDTSGPALNILVKLMAIISLVFANGFKETAFLGKAFGLSN